MRVIQSWFSRSSAQWDARRLCRKQLIIPDAFETDLDNRNLHSECGVSENTKVFHTLVNDGGFADIWSHVVRVA